MPQSTRLRPRFLILAALAALVLVTPASTTASLAPPAIVGPADGTVVDQLPVFQWGAVAGADKYEWEIAADSGFNSPVLGSSYDHFFTKNRRATLLKTIPNGTYFWHVRAVTSTGAVGDWSAAMSFTRDWGTLPSPVSLTAPADGGT